MNINFEEIDEQTMKNFKGGSGEILMRDFSDGNNKIMKIKLRPMSSIGLHRHDETSEVIYILKGNGHFICDGVTETFCQGTVHYCPMGHSHTMINDGDEDVEFLGIVAKH